MRTASVLLATLLLVACGAEPEALPAWRGEGNLVEVTLDDIHCEGCEIDIEEALSAVEGVTTVVADGVSKHVLVMLRKDVDREATIPALRDALHRIGHKIVGEDVFE